ncbi:VOC family protein [Clavibacter sp. MX14-G9D]|uniref:VOC family protein n=1 Tax=Clavibacter sp. MX14-G9D TaxID=3064656 RepID=UPI00293E46F0|nr:VOC family protein [Clavibacter sp. MX14-G9D]
MTPARGSLHHVELQVRDLDAALASWGWLLGELGYAEETRWSAGATLRLGDAYLVIARAPRDVPHDRRGAGLSHLAFHAGSAADVERLWVAAPEHGWAHLYVDRHPFAGGPDHRAAFLEDGERMKVELVADA